jgi:hypothetical protein
VETIKQIKKRHESKNLLKHVHRFYYQYEIKKFIKIFILESCVLKNRPKFLVIRITSNAIFSVPDPYGNVLGRIGGSHPTLFFSGFKDANKK